MKRKMKVLIATLAVCAVSSFAVGCGVDSIKNKIDELTCNHEYGALTTITESTCLTKGTAEKTCTLCGKKTTERLPLSDHSLQTVAAIPATCTEDGMTDYQVCIVCDEHITEPQTVKATGHTIVSDTAVSATCTESGKTAGSHCSACGQVEVAQKAIAPLGHSLITVTGKAATCTEAGLTDGQKCETCGTVYTEQTEITATGHTDADEDGTCDSCGKLTEAYINSTLSSLANGTQSHMVALAYTQPNYETDPTAVPIDNNLAVTSGNYYKAALGYVDEGWDITVSGIHVNADKTVSYGDIALPSVVTEDNQYVYFYVPSDVELQGEMINSAYASPCEFGLVVLYSEEVSTTLTALVSGTQSFTTENLVDSGYNLTSPIESGYYYRFALPSNLVSGYPDGIGITKDEVLFFNPVDNTVTFYGSEVQMTVTEDTKYVYFYLPDVGYTNNDISSIFASVCGFEKVIFSETETVATLSLRNVPAAQSEIICSAEDIYANSVWTEIY